HARANGRRRLDAGREVAAAEPGESDACPSRAALRARARAAAGRARRGPERANRLGRARGEDPHVQLPREPAHRPPDQADRAPARPDPRGRARRVHRGARDRRSPPDARGVTAREALAEAEQRLAAAGVETPRVDAEWLVAHLLGTTRSGLAARLDDEVEGLEPLLVRREAREPLAYVLGEWGFRRLTLKTDARALVPRPETETLVERTLALAEGIERPRILDVGVGSGAIALAIKDERPDAQVTGVDVSADALALARENAQRLGIEIELRQGDGAAAAADAAEGWDVAVANPPYVES